MNPPDRPTSGRDKSSPGNDVKVSASGSGQQVVRQSGAKQSKAYQPRQSYTGRGGVRMSARHSARGQGGGADGNDRLQVFDEEGVDRTPKPLLSLKPTVLKSVPGLMEETPTPESNASEMFMDRMSTAGFSQTGWYSGQTSGAETPKSEYGEDDEGKGGGQDGRGESQDGEVASGYEHQPELLTEKDLDKQMPVMLVETETIFLISMPCVTVALDSEFATTAEAMNKRYASLLNTKQVSDVYTDGEAQTLDLLKKNREIQSAVLLTADVQCQASVWDIVDTYQALEEGAADGDDGNATNVQSITTMAGAVSVGRMGGVSRPGSRNGSSTAQLWGNQSMMVGLGDRNMGGSGVSTASTIFRQLPGLPGAPGDKAEGGEPTSPSPEAPAANPLIHLQGLLDSLKLMDAACMQNTYLPQLLLYRNIRSIGDKRTKALNALSRPKSGRMSMDGAAAAKASASRPVSRTVSRSVSRIQSRAVSNGNSRAVSRVPSINSVGGRTSAADSLFPDDLLAQDLLLLGPDGIPSMDLLWSWNCPLTDGVNVACMAWNKARPDLLAVGYGNYSFTSENQSTSTGKGFIAFWSLKNPEYPIWSFPTRSGVTALDFATHAPNMLAAGLYDGTVSFYDVKNQQGLPLMESDATTGRHSDPVWKVCWLDRGAEREEVLVSISTDGRVTQWSIAKGLEFSDLMRLKRMPRRTPPAAVAPGAKAVAVTEQDPFISRLTSGMSFDFSSKDERIYIAGTEDGWIHRCSTSYNEQYLESYCGHMGPVYALQWSPFREDMFISASGDWTCRLWQEGRDSALLAFQGSNYEVNDVAWSPTNSTVFGCVTSGGRLEVWDFSLSTLKPVCSHKFPTGKQSCLLFSQNSPVVVCGGENGAVSVFRLNNLDREYDSLDEHLERLEEVITANAMKTQPRAGS